MGSRINYIALFIIVTVGVATGNLISNWITAEFVESEVEKATKAISKEISTQTKEVEQKVKIEQEKPKIQKITSQEYLMKQRELDDTGIRLAKKCSEWQIAHKDMQTQTSERGMKKHCEEYKNYIETGVLPNN